MTQEAASGTELPAEITNALREYSAARVAIEFARGAHEAEHRLHAAHAAVVAAVLKYGDERYRQAEEYWGHDGPDDDDAQF